MSRLRLAVAGALALLAVGGGASAANAAQGVVTIPLNLRAGPGTDYPVVAVMSAGDGVEIYGCLSGWGWCDIFWRGFRGWAAGSYLQVVYGSQLSPVYQYGGAIGIPFIDFSINVYWNEYYRTRPFFDELPRYAGPGPTYQPPEPPPNPLPPQQGYNPPTYPLFPPQGYNPPAPGPVVVNPPFPSYGGEGGQAGQSGCPGGTHHENGVCVR